MQINPDQPQDVMDTAMMPLVPGGFECKQGEQTSVLGQLGRLVVHELQASLHCVCSFGARDGRTIRDSIL